MMEASPADVQWPYGRAMPEAVEHPVTTFRRLLASLSRYPPGAIPVPAYIPGTAFFSAAAA